MKPPFAIVASAVFLLHHISTKNIGNKLEVESSFTLISGALGFVPFEQQRLIYHT